MPETCGSCKNNPVDIARKTIGTPTAKLIAILESHGITSAAEIAEIVGISDRAVRKARNSGSGTEVPGGTTGPELQDRSGTQVPKTELQDRNSGSAPSRAHATKEFPTEILVSKIQQQQPRVDEIHSAVVAAAGDALNPTSIGLNMVSDVLGWMGAGADLELDIVPTIAALSKGKRHEVNGWKFYAKAVATAKEKRQSGLPAIRLDDYRRDVGKDGKPMRPWSELMEEIRQEEAARAAV